MRVQVVGFERVEGVSKASGRPFSIRRAHCVCRLGDAQPVVAKIPAPRGVSSLEPGVYELVVDWYVSRDGLLTPYVAGFAPSKA